MRGWEPWEKEEGKAGRGRPGRGGGEAEDDECSGGAYLLRASGGKEGNKIKRVGWGPRSVARSRVGVAELYTVPGVAAVWGQYVSRGGLGTCLGCQ